MLSNENFKRSVDLCEKRDALLNLSKRINEDIKNPPQALDEYKRAYVKEHAHNGIIIFLCILTCFILLAIVMQNINFKTDDSFFIYLFFSIIISPLIIICVGRAIDKILLYIKGQPIFDEHEKEIADYYQNKLPMLFLERDKTNQEIQVIINELNSFDGIPSTEWDIATELWYLYSTHQADSYKEALKLWRKIKHYEALECEAREQTQLAKETVQYAQEGREYAYQSMLEAKRARETAEIGILLEAYNTYHISNID